MICLVAAGRKEAEMVKSGAATKRPFAGQGTRRSPDELEPVSVSNRRNPAVTRGGQAASAPVHAPKFASEDTPLAKPAGNKRFVTSSPACGFLISVLSVSFLASICGFEANTGSLGYYDLGPDPAQLGACLVPG